MEENIRMVLTEIPITKNEDSLEKQEIISVEDSKNENTSSVFFVDTSEHNPFVSEMRDISVPIIVVENESHPVAEELQKPIIVEQPPIKIAKMVDISPQVMIPELTPIPVQIQVQAQVQTPVQTQVQIQVPELKTIPIQPVQLETATNHPRKLEEPKIPETVNTQPPKLIFIVPYRDREQHQKFFAKQMRDVLEDYPKDSYKIWYIHQCDQRSFNRGAMKNIGFLVARQIYPNHYKNITFVFNDVDTMPFSKNFLHYETTLGNVKHFYGYKFALGGIVSIKGFDFERINGFPNYWGWGYEDNLLQKRAQSVPNLNIDRSQFYPIMDKNILQLKDGIERNVNRTDFDRYVENNSEGIYQISQLNYKIDESTGFVNIHHFSTGREENTNQTIVHDLRKGAIPFKPHPRQMRKNRMGAGMGLFR